MSSCGLVFPRRKDAMLYEQYDGSLESMQKIANLTRRTVVACVAPNLRVLSGDIVQQPEIEVGVTRVRMGQYVVVPADGSSPPNLCDPDQFEKLYSKDGN